MDSNTMSEIVTRFIKEEIDLCHGKFASSASIHERFLVWIAKQGQHPWTRKLLITELRQHGFTDGRSNGHRGLKGLRLR